TTQTVAAHRSADKGMLGKVAAAVPVKVVRKQAGKALVRVEGWTLADFPSQLFAEPGVRIEYATFEEEDTLTIDKKASAKVIADNAWVKASAQVWVPAKSLTGDVEGLWKKGKARLANACSSCHGAPEAAHFTANQWASQLPEKGGRAGHSRAGANEVMFKYLQTHAKKQ
ncbi:MAG: hypothetical protein ACI4SV_02545, partial [Duodenibacillus sp.]